MSQVGSSWFVLPIEEFTEGLAVVLVTGDPEQNVLHPFTRIYFQSFADVHQEIDDGCAHGGIVVPPEQEDLPAQGQRPEGFPDAAVLEQKVAVSYIHFSNCVFVCAG